MGRIGCKWYLLKSPIATAILFKLECDHSILLIKTLQVYMTAHNKRDKKMLALLNLTGNTSIIKRHLSFLIHDK